MQRILKAILAVCHFCILRDIAAQAWNSPNINIDGIPKGRSQLFSLPIQGPKCGYGGNFTFIVVRGENAEPNKDGKYEKVMVSFSTGGICANYETCLAYEMIYDQDRYTLKELNAIFGLGLEEGDVLWRGTVHGQEFGKAEVNDCMVQHLGLVPCSSPEFSDYVALAIPECTGDLFLGTQTTTYSFQTTYDKYHLNFDHHGALAVLLILPAFVAATGTPNNVQDLIVTGAGDGGWGALVWGGPIMEAFESTSAESSRGKLRTNVLVDSAFKAPLDNPSALTKMFSVLDWGVSAVTWRDKINIEPGNFVDILKEELKYYAGRFRVAFISCDQGEAADIFLNFIFSTGDLPFRIGSMWNFLGDIHQYDSTLGSTSDGSDSRVFSYIANCRERYLSGHVRDYIKHPLRGTESALKIDNWMDTFLTTGFPYKISSDTARVGGPSYNMQYIPKDAVALTKLKSDKNADKYWCCVGDLDEPGTTFDTRSFIIPDSYSAFEHCHRAWA